MNILQAIKGCGDLDTTLFTRRNKNLKLTLRDLLADDWETLSVKKQPPEEDEFWNLNTNTFFSNSSKGCNKFKKIETVVLRSGKQYNVVDLQTKTLHFFGPDRKVWVHEE